jgi:hypothetical protein
MTMAGTRSVVAGTPQGVAGDLVGIGTTSTGHIIVASKIGRVFDIDPNAGYAATVIFNNPFGVLQSVGGIAIDGQNRVLIFDRPPFTPNAGKVYRLENGTLTFLAFTSRGSRGAFDPLTGDVFIPQIGNIGDGGGEILRLDVHSSPPRAGNYRGNSFFVLPFGLTDGGIAFTSQGDFYTAVSQTGRAVKVNRATGARSTVAGNFVNPVGTAVAAGTVGVAGAQGSSLFVLDKFGIYEVGIPGSPPSHPSSTPPGLAPPADLRITGSVQLGGSNALTIESAPDANRVYLVVCGLSGKLPGLPLNTFGTPDDPRFIPNNPDQLWSLVNSPQVMPDFYGVLDGAGKSAPTMSLIVPNDPNLLINQFIDFTWVAIQFGFPNGFATVGGTTQIYLGN